MVNKDNASVLDIGKQYQLTDLSRKMKGQNEMGMTLGEVAMGAKCTHGVDVEAGFCKQKQRKAKIVSTCRFTAR